MPLYSFEGKTPVVHPEAFVAPTATLIGEVIVEAGASIWYNAVLRADLAPITIRAGANVQDGSVLHTPPDVPCEIGPGATVAHMCVAHGATIGAEALIGNNSTVLDGAIIGARSLIAAQPLVLTGMQIPDEVFVTGSPATVKGPIAGTNAEFWVRANPAFYQELGRRHHAGLAPLR